MSRVLVIGLDAFSPDLVERWLPSLPNLRALMERGLHGPLESIIQPVTPAAWTAMITGRNPGHFGFTDFTYRAESSYTDYKLVHSRLIKAPTLYNLVPAAGKRCTFVGVPITYPPVPIQDGVCVSCFMAPSLKNPIVYPAGLQQELLQATSQPYLLDVTMSDADQNGDRGEVLRQIREMDRQRFDISVHLMRTRPWDLFFLVCMGTDRVGHYFMRYNDPSHGRYDADPQYQNAIFEHYRYCDQRIGELLEVAGPDTNVLVVSDHGIQPMDGKIHLNDWLAANGYLVLTEQPDRPMPLSRAPVDWSLTRAWAHGYGGQIWLNRRDRDPQGCLSTDEAGALLQEMSARLSTELRGPNGEQLRTRVVRRRDFYTGAYAEQCPDLFIQVEGLRWLTSDTVGHRKLASPVTELGVDDAAHAPNGFFAMAGPDVPGLGRFAALHLLDVAPTVLSLLGISIPSDLEGQPIHHVDDGYSLEDEAELTNRLRSLYLD